MSIKVFISHSTWLKPDLEMELKDQVPAHSTFRDLLCERLRKMNDPEIDVIIDKDIPAACLWRDLLFHGLAECHAGIVLLNKQALFHSPWVDTEVTVLGYRAYTERDNFRLIIVPFGGLKATDIAAKKAWEAVALSELQVEPRAGLNEADPKAVEELAIKVHSILRGLPHMGSEAPSGWLVARLCNLLPSEPARLKSIAEALHLSHNQSDSTLAMRRCIAHFLYSHGPMSLLQLVKCAALPHDWDGLHALEILRTYWVDISASIGVLASCRRDASSKVVAINGKEVRYTPQTYVRQVCGEGNGWLVIDVDPADPRCTVADQIRETLAEDSRFHTPLKLFLGRTDRTKPEKVEEALNKTMALQETAPVFVTFFQLDGGNVDDIITDIHKKFPHIRIIVCTGSKPGASPVLPPEVQMLLPELDLEREKTELNAYCSVATRIAS